MGDVIPKNTAPLGTLPEGGPFLGVIAGVKREEALFSPIKSQFPINIALSAADPLRGQSEAMRLVDEGAVALLSFGFAGGLNPYAEPGTLYVPKIIRDAKRDYDVNLGIAHYPSEATSILTIKHKGYGSDALVATTQEKALLFASSNADFVDMESHRVAMVAEKADIPCFVIRAVSDTAEQVLPHMLNNAVTPNGGTNIGAILTGLLKNPGAMGDLARLSRQVKAAEKSLSAALDDVLPQILGRVELL